MKRQAFTLVELLVVIVILAVLMALLLPAVNSVRESMRRAQCKNNLMQLGSAAQAHLAAQGHFPSSGWGFSWDGDPDYGFGARQPGGWIYNSLPYMGLDLIHDKGKGVPDGGPSGSTDPAQNKYYALVEQETAVIPGLICPTRRKVIEYPATIPEFNVALTGKYAKTDYAANGGQNATLGCGPPYVSTFAGSCHQLFPNCDWTYGGRWPQYADSWLIANFNGISGPRTEINQGQVVDGLTNVFYAGEKYLAPDMYYNGNDYADNGSCLEGNDWDVNRWVDISPLRDTPGVNIDTNYGFGSPHPAGLHFVFCDGHVQMISYSIGFLAYQKLGVRNDGNPDESTIY